MVGEGVGDVLQIFVGSGEVKGLLQTVKIVKLADESIPVIKIIEEGAEASGLVEDAGKTGGLVDDVAKNAKSWLGKDYKAVTNKAGDNIFMSKDGLRKMRFDIKNPHGDAPHIHLEIFKNGKWKDAIPGAHRIYPKQ
jgi:hypothetical protein